MLYVLFFIFGFGIEGVVIAHFSVLTYWFNLMKLSVFITTLFL